MTITAAPSEEARASVQDSVSAWASVPASSAARAAGPDPDLASPSAAYGADAPGPAGSAEDDRRRGRAGESRRTAELWTEEDGLATAEYGIVMLAAVGFAGLLVAVLSSGEVQEMLHGIVERALSL
ncbi:DUF4244 domain-containing protein [Nesterenkonia sp. F]|uniref:DUF4244 domain-containing protein n=1 Tax=Nesterenkonia sp. F TaxID=795955 RepID=UPI000255CF78|nr:DUF4244 domain-containing protein [Nesterenkonia sp. F]